MSEAQTLTAARIPTVYFIDDSATMREVIKIAFRKENIHVITCADAASALEQFGEVAPDVVITDVIMPDKDGYEVCQFIKAHDQFSRTPVILMSGVVNRAVAEKAMTVKADELIRKPFQPQDLVVRVRNLIRPKSLSGPPSDDSSASAAWLQSNASSQALTSLFSPVPVTPSAALPASVVAATPSAAAPASALPLSAPRPSPQTAEVFKLRNEIRRLELLVKKLQAELAAGREYCAALEAHFKTSQESE